MITVHCSLIKWIACKTTLCNRPVLLIFRTYQLYICYVLREKNAACFYIKTMKLYRLASIICMFVKLNIVSFQKRCHQHNYSVQCRVSFFEICSQKEVDWTWNTVPSDKTIICLFFLFIQLKPKHKSGKQKQKKIKTIIIISVDNKSELPISVCWCIYCLFFERKQTKC